MAGAEHVVAGEAGLLGGGSGAFEQRDQGGILGADGDDGLGRAGGEGRDDEPLDDRPRIGGHQRRVGPDRGVRAVAIGHHVPLVHRTAGSRAPLPGGGEAAAAATAQAGRGDRGDRSRGAEIADRDPEAVERAGADRGVEVRRIRRDRVRATREDPRPVRRRREEPGHQLRAPVAIAQRGPERRAVVLLRGQVRLAGRRHIVDRGRLEPQVPVVRRGPVDHRVPGARHPGDVLERRDRQVAVLRPASPRGSRACPWGRSRAPRGSHRAGRGRSPRSG